MMEERPDPFAALRAQALKDRKKVKDVRADAWKVACCYFWVWSVILSIPIIVAAVWMVKKKSCDIPLYIWIIGFFGLIIFIYLTVLFWLPGLYSENSKRNAYCAVFWAILGLWLISGWVIYGYMIYFSDDNNCGQKADTRGWMIFMIILLFLGFFYIILALVVLCCLCCCCGPLTTWAEDMEKRCREDPECYVDELDYTALFQGKIKHVESQCCKCNKPISGEDEGITEYKMCGHRCHTACVKDDPLG